MKKYCLDLRQHVIKVINYEKTKMIPLTKKEEKNHNKQNFVIYVEKNLMQMIAIKNTIK